MIEILQKETGGDHFDPREIRSRLDDLMAAAGLFVSGPDLSQEEIDRRQAFSEAAGDQGDSFRDKALHYAKILESPDPFGEGLIHSIYRTKIDTLARGRNPPGVYSSYVRPHPSGDGPASLTDRLDHDLTLLRTVAERLKTYNELSIRQGAPNKGTRQALLIGLAELYVELTNLDIDPFELPHAEGSRFIRFCHLALEPYLPRTETGTGSLSKAWQRLKAAEKAAKS